MRLGFSYLACAICRLLMEDVKINGVFNSFHTSFASPCRASHRQPLEIADTFGKSGFGVDQNPPTAARTSASMNVGGVILTLTFTSMFEIIKK